MTTLKAAVAAGPAYGIRAFRAGQCRVKGEYAFRTWAKDRDHLFYVYVFVIRGNGVTAVVDTGLSSLEEMNRGSARTLLAELMHQEPGEDTASILHGAGVDASEVEYVLLTHCHYDHASNLGMFPNAEAPVPARAWRIWHEEADGGRYLRGGVREELDAWHAQGRLLLTDDEELVAPGIGVRWVGGHTPCSHFIYINTIGGVAILTGDAVQMYDNLLQDDPIGIYKNEEQCRMAIEIAREADILVPGHDPRVLERFPNGIIG